MNHSFLTALGVALAACGMLHGDSYTYTGQGDSIQAPKPYYQVEAQAGQELEAKVQMAYAPELRFRIYLLANSPKLPDPLVITGAAQTSDAAGQHSEAKLTRTIAKSGTYYMMVLFEQGSSSFNLTVTLSGAGPPDKKCVQGKITAVRYDATGNMDAITIGQTNIGATSSVKLPTSQALRSIFRIGAFANACYDSSGVINTVELLSPQSQ